VTAACVTGSLRKAFGITLDLLQEESGEFFGRELTIAQAQLLGPMFSPPEAGANRQARPTESATRGRSFRHPCRR